MKILIALTLVLFQHQLHAGQYGNQGRHADRNQDRVDTPIYEVVDQRTDNDRLSKRHHRDLDRNHKNRRNDKRNQKRHQRHSTYQNQNHHNDYDARPSRRWQPVSAFRGRTGRDVTRYINVEERVKAVSIQSTKRGMYVRRAHALLGNGRWIRVSGLEGHIGHGDRAKHRLSRDRYVRQIVLDIEPRRYKRGYAQLFVRPAH